MIVRLTAILSIVLLSCLVLWNPATAAVIRKVAGEVEAVDAAASPQTLVVKSTTFDGKELVVGCRLDDKTVVEVARRPAALTDIQSGDRVVLVYLRVEDGLICRKIEKK
jgi:hypothetical protein